MEMHLANTAKIAQTLAGSDGCKSLFFMNVSCTHIQPTILSLPPSRLGGNQFLNGPLFQAIRKKWRKVWLPYWAKLTYQITMWEQGYVRLKAICTSSPKYHFMYPCVCTELTNNSVLLSLQTRDGFGLWKLWWRSGKCGTQDFWSDLILWNQSK